MLNTALEYIDQGFSVIPVAKSTKKPLLKAWKEFQSRIATAEELEQWWDKWPDANIAIITGKISNLVVVDADSQKGIDFVLSNYPLTPVTAKTAKGMHFYYLYPWGDEIKNAVRVHDDVDIRAEGGYVIAPPSIHATGHIYKWEFASDGGFDDIPEYEPVKQAPEEKKSGNLNINLTRVKTSPTNEGVKKGSRNNKLAELAGKWVNTGLDFEDVFVLAKNWNSKNNPPLGEKEIKRTIRSIQKIDRENHPEFSNIPETPELKPAEVENFCPEIDDDLINPGGVLQKMMTYIDKNSSASVPFFALGASLSFFGAVLGQKVMTESKLRTNLYCLSVGYSGSGKNAALTTLPPLLSRSAAKEILGPTEFTSDSALLAWMANVEATQRRNTWLCVDETGQLLKGMKNPNSPQAGIPRLMTKLFSNTGNSETKGYANSSNNIFLPWHHLSFYGATVPERLWTSINVEDITDGLLARLLLFESLHDAPFPNYNICTEIPETLIDAISEFYKIETKWFPEGNIDTNKKPIPNIIPKTAPAMKYFEQFAWHYHNLKIQFKEDERGFASIYGRAAEHASKIALIHAMSKYGVNCKEVGLDSVEYSCKLVTYIINNVIYRIKENITTEDTDIAKLKMRIIKNIKKVMIKNKGKKDYTGATLRDIQRGSGQGVLSETLKKILADMVVAEIIGVQTITNKKGRAINVYYAV